MSKREPTQQTWRICGMDACRQGQSCQYTLCRANIMSAGLKQTATRPAGAMDSASASEAEGCRFESCAGRQSDGAPALVAALLIVVAAFVCILWVVANTGACHG